jgi:hypothetical protein
MTRGWFLSSTPREHQRPRYPIRRCRTRRYPIRRCLRPRRSGLSWAYGHDRSERGLADEPASLDPRGERLREVANPRSGLGWVAEMGARVAGDRYGLAKQALEGPYVQVGRLRRLRHPSSFSHSRQRMPPSALSRKVTSTPRFLVPSGRTQVSRMATCLLQEAHCSGGCLTGEHGSSGGPAGSPPCEPALLTRVPGAGTGPASPRPRRGVLRAGSENLPLPRARANKLSVRGLLAGDVGATGRVGVCW